MQAVAAVVLYLFIAGVSGNYLIIIIVVVVVVVVNHLMNEV